MSTPYFISAERNIKMKNALLLAVALLVSSAVFAEQSGLKGEYNYKFPLKHATPFDAWNTGNAVMKPEDREAAEFGAMFAGRMMTIVTRVEDTKDGKRAYVIVAHQNCMIDMVRQGGEYRASATKCSTKSFGKF